MGALYKVFCLRCEYFLFSVERDSFLDRSHKKTLNELVGLQITKLRTIFSMGSTKVDDVQTARNF